ncbi:immunoglobulin-like domain-containing protein [Enterococcus avium]|uniref:immunoglobulin-like domain-containing protein n=1 Tax=Enterococcus avium TaxID=33945 RepID=UPI001F589F27|nr:immunoglobulin-like domain-containing protein [Enterococcus avium]
MKKKMKAKKIAKSIKAKKTVTAAATALILSGSPIATISTFAEESIPVAPSLSIQKAKGSSQENISNKIVKQSDLMNRATVRAMDTSHRPQLGNLPKLATETTTIGKKRLLNGWSYSIWHGDGSSPVIPNSNLFEDNTVDTGFSEYNIFQIEVLNPDTAKISTITDKANVGMTFANSIKVIANRTHRVKISATGKEHASLGLRSDDKSLFLSDVKNDQEINETVKPISDQLRVEYHSGYMAVLQATFESIVLEYEKEWNAIDDLFANPEHSLIRDNVTAADVNYVQGLVDSLGDSNKDKIEMQQELDKLWKAVSIEQTTIDPVSSKDTVIKGTGEPGGIVEITKFGSILVGKGIVDENGNYSIQVAKQPQGVELTASVSAYNGRKTSTAKTTVTEKEIAKTTMNSLTTTSTKATGTAEPNAKIELRNGDKVIAEGTVGSDGKYSLTIDPQTEGSTIIAVVTKDGLESQASTVVTREVLEKTTISAIDTTTTSVSGTAEPNAKIEIKVGDKVIAEGRVGSDGNYSLTIPKQTVGTVVKAVATLDGKTSEAETAVVRGELSQTTISEINSKTTTVTGTAEPNAKIELKNGDKVIASGTVGSDGKYSLTIDPQLAGSTIIAIVTKDGKESQASTIVTNETEGTVKPSEYVINGGDNYIRGTYTGDVNYLKLEVNGKEYAKSTVSGSPFKYYAVDKVKKATDKIYIVAYDKDGKQLDRKQVVIKDATTKGTVTPNDYTLQGDNYIRGTYTGDVNYLKLEVNGKEYAKSTVSGSPFKYYAADKVKKSTDVVYLVAYDKNGNQLDRKKVTIHEPEMNISLKADAYAVGGVDNYVHGTFSGTGSEKIDYVRLEVNDVLYARTTKFNDGKFDYYAVDKIKSTSDKVYLVAYDKDGNQLARTQVILRDGTTQGTVSPNKFLLGGSDNYVRGTYTGDVDSLKLEVNGKILVKSTVKSSPFQYYAVDKIKNVTDKVFIIAYDANGRQLDRKQVMIDEAVKTQITKVDTYTLGVSNYVTGTYDGTAKKVGITVNGMNYSPVNIKNAGQLSYWSKNIITSSSDDVKITIYDADGVKLDEKPVSVVQQDGQITKIDPFKVGFDSRVTGTVSGAVARVELNVNGVAQSRIPVTNGSFSYYAKNVITSSKDVVKVTAYDSTGNKLDEKDVSLRDAEGTLTIDSTTYSLKNSDGRIHGNVTGDISKS